MKANNDKMRMNDLPCANCLMAIMFTQLTVDTNRMRNDMEQRMSALKSIRMQETPELLILNPGQIN